MHVEEAGFHPASFFIIPFFITVFSCIVFGKLYYFRKLIKLLSDERNKLEFLRPAH
jgi:hypothetical protein